MPDVYANITAADSAVQQKLAEVLELRAADPQQQAMLASYLNDTPFRGDDRVLEVGCGTGAVSRVIAGWEGVREVIGVDPSPIFLAQAREFGASLANLSFIEADGRSLPFPDRDFDVVIFHTVLTHVPHPEQALSEAYRVLRPGGTVVVFDGDYSTMTVAIGDQDPLQTCVDATRIAVVNDPWLIRKLPQLFHQSEFQLVSSQSHGYMQPALPDYLFALVDRGADALLNAGRIGPDLCAALKGEARRRLDANQFFGFIGYASFVARKFESTWSA